MWLRLQSVSHMQRRRHGQANRRACSRLRTADSARATGHKGAVLELHWTTDGERIASASPDKSVRVWDAATGAQVLIGFMLG